MVKHLSYGVQEQTKFAVELLIAQGVTVDMFKEHVLTLLMDNSANIYNSLDTKTKTAFTRQYNTA